MTTETNSDKQTEPDLLSDAEIEAAVGGSLWQGLYAMALARRDLTADNLLPRSAQ